MQILHGLNAERCLLAGEALGLGYVALEKAAKYAKERVVFGRPIGQNQGIQHPLADAYMNLEAAKLATYHATRLYDASKSDASITQHAVGVACNSAKYLAAEAAFTACERAVGIPRSYLQNMLIWLSRYSRMAEWAMHKSTMSSVIFANVLCPELRLSVG